MVKEYFVSRKNIKICNLGFVKNYQTFCINEILISQAFLPRLIEHCHLEWTLK